MNKTVDPREICKGIAKIINIPDSYKLFYKQWDEAYREATGKEPSELDIFYAGYIMANPNVRDLYKLYGGKARDEKIELHRNDSIH